MAAAAVAAHKEFKNVSVFKGFESNLKTIQVASGKIADFKDDLLDCCNGSLYVDEGIARLVILKPESPSFYFDIHNITGDISRDHLRQKTNKLNVKFVSEDLNWETDIISIQNDAFLEQDKGKIYESDLDLRFCIDYNHAYYFGVQKLKQSRLSTKITFKAFWEGYKVALGDVISVTHDDLGFDTRLFRVESMILDSAKGLIEFECSEYDEDVYTVQNIDPKYNNAPSSLPNPFDVQPPATIKAHRSYSFDNQGNFLNPVHISWKASPSPDIAYYVVDYKPLGYGDWESLGRTSGTEIVTNDLLPGDYDIRIKAVNSISAHSKYAKNSIEVNPPHETPPDVERLTLVDGYEGVSISWDPVRQITHDGFYRLRHSTNTQNASWDDPSTLDILVPATQLSHYVGSQTGTYMVKAVSPTGEESTNPAKVIFSPSGLESFEQAFILQEEASFSGTHNKTVVESNKLSLAVKEPAWIFDTATGNFDSLPGDFDDGGGSTEKYFTLGIYDFANRIEFDEPIECKIQNCIVTQKYKQQEFFNDITGNFDDAVGLFDEGGDAGIFAQTYYRFSQDESDWSEWHELTTNTVKAKYIEFQCRLNTQDETHNILVSELQVKVYLRERIEQRSVYVSNTNQPISFIYPFYAAPSVNIGLIDPNPGDTAQISNISSTGFTINVLDKDGINVPRNITYTANGVGRYSS